MLRKRLTFMILIGVNFCFVICIESKICYGAKEGIKFEQNENVSSIKDVAKTKEPLANREFNVNLFTLIAKTIFSLLIITGLIYFILRFFWKSQRWITKQQGFIQIIATQYLAPNKYIQLIEIGNKLFVIGVSDQSINLLTEIDDKEVIDSIKTQVSRQEDKMSLSFIQHLKEKFHGQEIDQTSSEEKLKFLSKQRERLKNLEL